MSPTDTDTEKQAKRHVPALVGIVSALFVAALLAAIFIIIPRMPADEQATPVPAPDGSSLGTEEGTAAPAE